MGMPTAAEMIPVLELKSRPEGGHYRETFRDCVKWKADRPPPQSFTCWRMANARTGTASTRWRSGITTLGRRSSCCWSTAPRKEIFRLGVDIDAAEVRQVAVPARVWVGEESGCRGTL